MTGTPSIWRREFYRVRDPNQASRDFEAEPDFAKANFVDFFGKTWIPSHPNAVTFDDVLRPMWNESQPPAEHVYFRVFAVADGSVVQSDPDNEKWLSQGLRFIAIVAGSTEEGVNVEPFGNKCWTLCIVGSSNLTSPTAFLQVASWDGTCFRFYGRERVNGQSDGALRWIFMGDSFQAFGKQSYMGPFNGHVNGSLVMKELHRPWIHWLVPANGFVNRMKKSTLEQFNKFPYLSDPEDDNAAHTSTIDAASGILSKVESAELMETHMTSGVNRWYGSRRQADFFDEKKQPRSEVKNVKRWIAHILLTTTVNIVAGADNPSGEHIVDFPIAHFYNTAVFSNDAAETVQPTVETSNKLVFSTSSYEVALDAIGLALVQQVPGANQPQPDYSKHPKLKEKIPTFGREREMFIVQAGEGDDISFTALHASYEDSQATSILMNLKTPLLSKDCIAALLMVDPWNPIYSWRRGVLMQYVPETTKLLGTFNPKQPTAAKYDLESKIEAAVRDSPRFKNEPDSPEREFIANLEAQRKGTAKFSERMNEYLTKVMGRLNDPKQNKDAVLDYLKLAESRRRVFRPIPLDEFALTLPWATKWDVKGPLEMTSDGTIRLVPTRGKKFLQQWIGSLASWDPQMMPQPDANGDSDNTAALSLFSLEEPAVLNIGCQASVIPEYRLGGGCPVMSLRQQQGE